jgi:5-methylcytosine-specific restriction endonuclease McrA
MFRTDALTKQGGLCAYCRTPLTAATATADHVVSRKRYGQDRRANIKACCQNCNLAKGSMGEAEFLKIIKSGEAGNTRQLMAWASRRINLATERSCKRLRRYAGLPS